MDNFDAHKRFKKQYLAEDSLNDKAKRYFLQKVKRGEIDTLPENPKEEFLKQMMKDQMDHDKETLRKEKGLEEAMLYPDYDDIIELIKNKTRKHGGSEIDEAIDVMEFIGQHYGINFEFGRG